MNCIDYPGDIRSPAVSVLYTKIHINGIILDTKHGARYLLLDVKNFYIRTLMSYFQYMYVHHTMMPQEVVDQYNLRFETDGHIYF